MPVTSSPRRLNPQPTIVFSTAAFPVGRLLVAATQRGICRVMLGDADLALVSELRAEYPRAVLQRRDRALVPAIRALIARLSGRAAGPLRLDVPGTAFQQRVWRQLQRIPFGRTRSYGEVARALGRPTAARAVAQACASNPVAVAIPCHRVVQGNGGLGGYRWGVGVKGALLAQERTASKKRSWRFRPVGR